MLPSFETQTLRVRQQAAHGAKKKSNYICSSIFTVPTTRCYAFSWFLMWQNLVTRVHWVPDLILPHSNFSSSQQHSGAWVGVESCSNAVSCLKLYERAISATQLQLEADLLLVSDVGTRLGGPLLLAVTKDPQTRPSWRYPR